VACLCVNLGVWQWQIWDRLYIGRQDIMIGIISEDQYSIPDFITLAIKYTSFVVRNDVFLMHEKTRFQTAFSRSAA
jgi:hypothetical protein